MGNCSTAPKGRRCDKCDGKHLTDECKVYPKPREEHPDAQRSGPIVQTKQEKREQLVVGAQVVKQPADNHCLYHALCFGFGKALTPAELRSQLSKWVLGNLDVDVEGRPMSEWIAAEYPNDTLEQYAELMCSSSRWGGLPELMGCAILHRINIRVWEKDKHDSRRFKLISKFTPSHSVHQGSLGSESSLLSVTKSSSGSSGGSLRAACSGGMQRPASPRPSEDCDIEETIDILFNRSRCHYDSLLLPSGHPLRKPQPAVRRTREELRSPRMLTSRRTVMHDAQSDTASTGSAPSRR